MPDFSYAEAMRLAWLLMIQEIVELKEDVQRDRLTEFYASQARVTASDIAEAQETDRMIQRDIRATDTDLPPSIVAYYKEGMEAQRKANSTFPIPGSSCTVQLNPNDTITISNTANLTLDGARALIDTLETIANLVQPGPMVGSMLTLSRQETSAQKQRRYEDIAYKIRMRKQ